MSSLRRHRRAGLALVVLALALLGVRLQSSRAVVRTGNGIRLSRLEAPEVPLESKVQGTVGDFLLESDVLSLIIGASTVTPEQRTKFGRILDVAAGNWNQDGLESLGTNARISGRAAIVTTTAVTPTFVEGAPAVRISQTAYNDRLWLTTLLRVRTGVPYVEITTRIENRGKAPIKALEVGDYIAWTGVPTFVPGIGEIEDKGKRTLRWFGRRGPALAYAMVYPDVPANVEFQSGVHPLQTAWSLPATIAPGEEKVFLRYLVASWRSMADAASWAHRLCGQFVGHVVGRLEPPPPSALLTAMAPDGSVALRSQVEWDGTFDLPLAPGRYTLLLDTPGGTSETLVDVRATGPPTTAEFVMPRPGSLVFRVTDSADRPMPARLIVKGIGTTPDPIFGPDFSAAGGHNEIHSGTGTGSVELPRGKYEVLITRGPEFSLVKRSVTIRAGEGVVLPAILVHEVDPHGWIAGDFHLHAAPSIDSEVTLEDRIASLLAGGVDFAVATDHNHVTDYEPFVRAAVAEDRLGVGIGVEITTKDWGHFNAYPVPKNSKAPPFAGIAPKEIFAFVREKLPGAVLQVNHPWMAGYGYFRRAALNEATGDVWRKGFSFDFDTLEIVNGFELSNPDALDQNLSRWFKLLNLGRHYTAVGNSDSHKVSRQWAGYPRTYVNVEHDEPGTALMTEIASALRAGRTVVSMGPFVDVKVNGVGPGGLARADGETINVSVTVTAADWIDVASADIIVDGVISEVLLARPAEQGNVRIDQTVELRVEADAWLVVVVKGTELMKTVLPGVHVPPFAFTNAIFIDVDGDGVYRRPEAKPPELPAPIRAPPVVAPQPQTGPPPPPPAAEEDAQAAAPGSFAPDVVPSPPPRDAGTPPPEIRDAETPQGSG